MKKCWDILWIYIKIDDAWKKINLQAYAVINRNKYDVLLISQSENYSFDRMIQTGGELNIE